MKKIMLPVAAVAALLANGAAAEADVYGKINLSLNRVMINNDLISKKDEHNIQLVSHASRLGFVGDQEITPELKALAKIEYEVAADGDLFGGTGENVFTARNVYAGVEGAWGQITAGRADTPVKLLGKKADLFNDYYLGDIKSAVEGENRVSNMVQYIAPKFAGLTIHAMAVAGEESGRDDSSTTPEEENQRNGLDGLSMTADYQFSDASIAIGFDHDVDKRDLVRVAGDVKFGSFTVGGLVQASSITDEDLNGQADETGAVISASYKLDAWKFKAQFGSSKIDVGLPVDETKRQFVAGVDYKLAKTSKVYGYLAMVQHNGEGVDLSGDDVIDGYNKVASDTFGFGFEHKF